jgi:hypothetical protein
MLKTARWPEMPYVPAKLDHCLFARLRLVTECDVASNNRIDLGAKLRAGACDTGGKIERTFMAGARQSGACQAPAKALVKASRRIGLPWSRPP